MRIVFAGTPPFAAAALSALIDAGFEIPLVLSQPDRRSGRGMKLTPSAVKTVALNHGIAVLTPASLSLAKGGEEAAQAHEALRQARPDVLVVAAYGLILPRAVLDIPSGVPGCPVEGLTAINIHASLLPRWRGAAPIARAIAAGDEYTGVTLMQMDAGLDTGPMLAASRVRIEPHHSSANLTEELAGLGARMVVQALSNPASLAATPQPCEGALYANKLDKSEAPIDWNAPARAIAARIRAFDPFPGSTCQARGTALKVWNARACEGSGAPGTVLEASRSGVKVACGEGAVLLTQLQRPGAKRLAASQFLQGFPLHQGDLLQ